MGGAGSRVGAGPGAWENTVAGVEVEARAELTVHVGREPYPGLEELPFSVGPGSHPGHITLGTAAKATYHCADAAR